MRPQMSLSKARSYSLIHRPSSASTPTRSTASQNAGCGQQDPNLQPTYAALFRCIGSSCEDTCCGNWDIPVDKMTYHEYRQFPAERLGSLVAHFVSEPIDTPHDNLYAYIHRKLDGSCPFFTADRLCGIQTEYGAELLTSTCSLYPRSLSEVQGRLEGTLSLSCPEAARTVLLEEYSTEDKGNLLSGEFRTDNVFGLRQCPGLDEFFSPIRSLVTAHIKDRSRPMWQRLLTIGSLCSRLDALGSGNFQAISPLLTTYENALGQGASSELNRLAPNIATRLDIAITLSDSRCRDPDCGQRFRNAFWDFIEGIGSSDGADPDEDVRRFIVADRDYLAPLFNQSPFILENYLLNYIYQYLFPFGRSGSDQFIARSMFDEAVLLLTQFSWLTTLLTGIAGRHGHEFSQTHVIAAVQSFTRAVEHVPQILDETLAFTKSRNLNSLEGLAQLLRAES
jgi:lysine-N-methylase